MFSAVDRIAWQCESTYFLSREGFNIGDRVSGIIVNAENALSRTCCGCLAKVVRITGVPLMPASRIFDSVVNGIVGWGEIIGSPIEFVAVCAKKKKCKVPFLLIDGAERQVKAAKYLGDIFASPFNILIRPEHRWINRNYVEVIKNVIDRFNNEPRAEFNGYSKKDVADVVEKLFAIGAEKEAVDCSRLMLRDGIGSRWGDNFFNTNISAIENYKGRFPERELANQFDPGRHEIGRTNPFERVNDLTLFLMREKIMQDQPEEARAIEASNLAFFIERMPREQLYNNGTEEKALKLIQEMYETPVVHELIATPYFKPTLDQMALHENREQTNRKRAVGYLGEKLVSAVFFKFDIGDAFVQELFDDEEPWKLNTLAIFYGFLMCDKFLHSVEFGKKLNWEWLVNKFSQKLPKDMDFQTDTDAKRLNDLIEDCLVCMIELGINIDEFLNRKDLSLSESTIGYLIQYQSETKKQPKVDTE